MAENRTQTLTPSQHEVTEEFNNYRKKDRTGTEANRKGQRAKGGGIRTEKCRFGRAREEF